MQNEKTDTFESLYPAANGSKLLKIRDNLTPNKTRLQLVYYSKLDVYHSKIWSVGPPPV